MGRLLTIEGLDGCGKETQARLLCQRLEEAGSKIRYISFPNYDSPSAAPLKMYLDGKLGSSPDDVNAYAASSFFAVDRIISRARDWGQFYDDGGIVIANRYTTSNAVHQMSKLPREQWDGFCDWLFDYEYDRLGLPCPDLVVMLTMPRDVSQQLLLKRYHGDNSRKDIHEKSPEYMERCADCAFYAAQKYGWVTVNCAPDGELLPIDAIGELVYSAVCSAGLF